MKPPRVSFGGPIPVALALAATVLVRASADQNAQARASDQYKNLQVLPDLSAGELMRIMHLMRASLGAHCDFCHDVDHYEADTKPAKVTARRMIQMVIDINKTNFGGNAVVTCNTCHRGATKPTTVPTIEQGLFPDTTRSPQLEPTLRPTREEILERYVAAMGGRPALLAIQSRTGEGIFRHSAIATNPDGSRRAANRGAQSPITITTSGPDAVMLVTPVSSISIQSHKGTAKTGTAESALSSDEIESLEMRYALRSELTLASAASAFSVRDATLLDGRTMSVLERRLPGGRRERLYFDTADGLLRRRELFRPTLVGEDPLRIDFDEYRVVDGVRVPFVIKTSVLDDNHTGTTVQFTSVKQELRRDAPRPRVRAAVFTLLPYDTDALAAVRAEWAGLRSSGFEANLSRMEEYRQEGHC